MSRCQLSFVGVISLKMAESEEVTAQPLFVNHLPLTLEEIEKEGENIFCLLEYQLVCLAANTTTP